MLKFIYSEKATRFCKISIVDLFYVVPVKSTVEISQNLVPFSEYMNFNILFFLISTSLKVGYSEKATKFEKNLPLRFDIYSVISNLKGRFSFSNLCDLCRHCAL